MRWFAVFITALAVALAGGRFVMESQPAARESDPTGRESHPTTRESEPAQRTRAKRTNDTVERVTDGDTVRLRGLGRTRLIGVDTPEVYGGVECYGREASAFAKRLLKPGARVRYKLGVEKRDRYGRALAYLWLEDGRFFNLMLVERGYASVLTIPPNVEYADRFRAAARRARGEDRGLWSRRTCAGRT